MSKSTVASHAKPCLRVLMLVSVLVAPALTTRAAASDAVLDWITIMNNSVLSAGISPLATSRVASEMSAAVFDAGERQHVEVFEQCCCFAATMGFRDSYDYVDVFFFSAACCLQHCIGFADAGGCAEKYLQLAALAFFFFALEFVE